jgi:hypothetical protein
MLAHLVHVNRMLPLPDLYFKSYGAVARGNPNYFITYGNGKSGEFSWWKSSSALRPAPKWGVQGSVEYCRNQRFLLWPWGEMLAAAASSSLHFQPAIF